MAGGAAAAPVERGGTSWRRVAAGAAAVLALISSPPAGADAAPSSTGAAAAVAAGATSIGSAGSASAGAPLPVAPGSPSAATSAPASSGAASGATPRVEREPARRRWEVPLPRGRVLAAQAEERWGRWALGGSSDPSHPASRPGFHPGTRVRVDARVVEGRLPARVVLDRRTGRRPRVLTAPALVAAARRQGYWPFRLCFEDAVRDTPSLAGRVRWTARVGPRGQVSDVALVGSAWKHAEGEACLARELRRLRFAPPPSPVRVGIDVAVWPGDVPLPARPPAAAATAEAAQGADVAAIPRGAAGGPGAPRSPEPAPGASAPTGEVSLAAVDASLEALGGAPEACLLAARSEDPALWGRLALRVVIDRRGRLVRVREEGTRFPATAAVACVSRALRSARWPSSVGGEGEVVVAWRLAAPDGDAEGLPPLARERTPKEGASARPAPTVDVGAAPVPADESGIRVGPAP